jgi:hypothetical protein
VVPFIKATSGMIQSGCGHGVLTLANGWHCD